MSIQTDINNNFDVEVTRLLKSIADDHGFEDYDVKKASGSMKGDGYLGVITATELSGIKDSTKKILNLVVKSAIKGTAVRNEIPIADVFQREIYMYNTVIPSLQQFLISKNLPLFPSFAKCYKATVTANSEALIMENLKTNGYKLWERRTPMNEEHVELVMKQYGRFHALSFAMKDQDPVTFERLTKDMDDLLQKFVDGKDFLIMMIKEHKKVSEMLDSSKDAEALRLFNNFINEIPDFLNNVTKLPTKYTAILHGDCWTNNMMFKYDDIDSANTPTKVCFIDLQVARVAPPVLDTAYFFYACSSRNILDNFQHYLDLYYKSLADYLKKLGSDPEKVYPYSVFLQQWKELAKHGLLIAVIIIKIMMSEQDEVTDFVDMAGSGKPIAEAFSYSISKSSEYNERMRHLILHFVKNGFF